MWPVNGSRSVRNPHQKLLESAPLHPPAQWLIRLPQVFSDFEPEVLDALGARVAKKPGRDYRLVRCADPTDLQRSAAAKFVSWNLPLHHTWPCQPRDINGFVEKAAQALARKFSGMQPQTVLIGALDPGVSGRYYRTLASNLRGRLLQIMPPAAAAVRDAESQDARQPTLYGLLGKEGLFCGMQSPLESGGFHPGGTRFIRQDGADTISRAGAKIAEALHHLRLHRKPPPVGTRWLELGASPGGMTAELLARKYRVTAVDRAPLDLRLKHHAGLRSVVADAGLFTPPPGESYGAILSDMNGDPAESLARVIRLSHWLDPGGLVVFTLKTSGITGYEGLQSLDESTVRTAAAAGLNRIAITHLTYNRREFTVFFEKTRK
jgi:23S rRNA (cytidine2498-2'-O)-methyltransferase